MCDSPNPHYNTLSPSSSSSQPSVEQPPHDHSEKKQVEVQFKNVSFAYDDKQIVRNVDLSIYSGETLAIIGVSGTGKSTTLRLISGLQMPDEGEIYLRGIKRLYSISDRYRANGRMRDIYENEQENKDKLPILSMVFQNGGLLDSLSIYDNLKLVLTHQKKVFQLDYDDDDNDQDTSTELFQIIAFWLSQVNLVDSMNKLPEDLSGGMRKRASFARAVCFHPKFPNSSPDIILFDEPTAGLSPPDSTKLENLINHLKKFCSTNVIVTHQFSTIRNTADRVVFLHQGKIVWDGSIHQLDTTDNPYVRQFMSSSEHGPLTDGNPEFEDSVGNSSTSDQFKNLWFED